MQQVNDSILTTEGAQQEFPNQHASHELQPWEVLRWLPKNATPAQQDSAIRAHIQPKEIHWSQQPDTLHLPGQDPGVSLKDFSLPQYYKESFFSKQPWFHPELNGGRQGVAGDPIPYTIASDNLITSLLLFCFILSTLTFSRTQRFISRQLKAFFYSPRSHSADLTETGNELRFQMFMGLQTCLLFALIYFFYIRTYVTSTFTIEQYEIIGIFTGVIATYFLFKAIAYESVGWVFFDRKKNEQWMKSYLFLMGTEGVLLFPLVMLLAYFNLSMKAAVFYALSVVVIFKILTLYRSSAIFFNRKAAIVQIFLYFCTLELMPLMALWGVLTLIVNNLKIIF